MNKVSASLPSWLNDLTEMLQKKKNEITAINVQNLPTVNWEGETFYVKFNNDSATLYNKFATVVKELDNASTIEDVDRFLNENTVTASAEDETITDRHDAVEEVNEKTESPADEFGDELTKQLEEIMTEEDTPATDEQVDIEDPEEVSLPTYQEDIAFLKEQVRSLTETVSNLTEQLKALTEPKESDLEVTSKIAELEKKYAELYHAYTAPDNDQYDLNSQEQEMKHVDECIELSQKIIDKEHELDLSKQSDRGKLNADFLKEILDEVKDSVQEAVEDSIEETKDIVEEVVENAPEEACPNGDCDIPVIEEDIILLDDPDSLDEFAKQVCPFCHEEKLEAVDMSDGKIQVKCANCSKEFSVEQDTNKIFAKMR